MESPIVLAHRGLPEPAPEEGDALARGLGWLSLGLGAAELAAPRAIVRVAGLSDRGGAPLAIRAMGVRELACGLAILLRSRRPWPLWMRVAGDIVDVALLSWAIRARRARRSRALAALGVNLGLAALDVIAGRRASRIASHHPVRQAISINRPPEEVYAFFRDLERLPEFMEYVRKVHVLDDRHAHWTVDTPVGRSFEWDAEIVEDVPGHRLAWETPKRSALGHRYTVTFTEAPGRRGTEVLVELWLLGPHRFLGSALSHLVADAKLEDDLRRLKQLMETGEIVRATPAIHDGIYQGHRVRVTGGLR